MSTYRVTTETKKCFFENEDTGRCGFMVHQSAYIEVLFKGEVGVVFKITGKGNLYDSRDKGKKKVTRDFVRAELCRMMDATRAACALQEAGSEMRLALV
jgi:hypothetical protein